MKQNKLTLNINKLPPLMKRQSRSHDEKKEIGNIIKDLNNLLTPTQRGQSNNKRTSFQQCNTDRIMTQYSNSPVAVKEFHENVGKMFTASKCCQRQNRIAMNQKFNQNFICVSLTQIQKNSIQNHSIQTILYNFLHSTNELRLILEFSLFCILYCKILIQISIIRDFQY
ncbi:hypothetical protein pb186bvf_013439 [Paramecium bursaria]